MVSAWGGYSNGQIPLSAMRQVGGQYFEPDMADRMEWLIAKTGVRCQEGYRPLGIPADQYVRNESQTSTGGSNQWFQWGRYQRGETPSAGTPGTSSHGWGKAADITPGRENPTVANACAQVGLIFTVASESWHVAADGTPTVPYKKTKRKTMIIVNNGKAAYLVGQQFLHHLTMQELQKLEPVLGAQNWWGGPDFDAVLNAYGIPKEKAAAVLGNKTWSRELEILDALAKGGVTPSPAPAVDVAAIAKAVNDDAAKRMAN